MSETVQKNLELTVKDLEHLRARNILTEEEIRQLIVARKEFEYKWNGQGKCVKLLTSYIQYETTFLGLIFKRRQELEPGSKMDSIEFALIAKITGLYVLGLERFRDDVEFGLRYFGFCLETSNSTKGSQVLKILVDVENAFTDTTMPQAPNTKCTSLHNRPYLILSDYKRFPHVSEVCHVAFNFWAYDFNDLEQASKILHKGLAHNKDSQKLWMDLIGLEIKKEIGDDYIKPEPNAPLSEKEQICISKLAVVMLEVTAAVKDPQFYIKLLNQLEIYDFLLPIQQDIVHFLLNNCGGDAEVWNLLAQREAKGIPVKMLRTEKPTRTTQEERMKACSNIFKEGLDKVLSKNRRQLCEFFIEFMIGFNVNDKNTKQVKAQLVSEALEIAQMKGFIFDKYKLLWRKMLSRTKQTGLVEKALEEYPDDESIWNLYFSNILITRDERLIHGEFERGIAVLKDRAYQLWAQLIRYSMLTASDAELDSLYLKGIKQPGEVAIKLKPKYLKWVGMNKGIQSARAFYHSVVNELPHIKELHETMSMLEGSELVPDFKNWHIVHELLCKQFGKDNYNVWAQRIKLYHLQESVVPGDIKKHIQEILAEAHANLSNDMYQILEEEYNSYVTSQNDCGEDECEKVTTVFDMFGEHLKWTDSPK